MPSSDEVAASAREMQMGDALFEQIEVGERFRFAASPPDETLVKITLHRYRVVGGRGVFVTGARTTVFRLP